MFKSIHQSFATALVLLLIIIILMSLGASYFLHMNGLISKDISTYQKLHNDLIEFNISVLESLSLNLSESNEKIINLYKTINDQLSQDLEISKDSFIKERNIERLTSLLIGNKRTEFYSDKEIYEENSNANERYLAWEKIESGIQALRKEISDKQLLFSQKKEHLYLVASRSFIFAIILLGGMIIGLTIMIFRRVLNPLARMRQTMITFSEGTYHERAENFKVRELSHFSSTFNRMADNLEQTIHNLKMTNENLESFSYSVSHDLRGPLRSMAGFSRVLEEDYSHQMDEKALGYLQKIQLSALRMGDLIEDILRLSRVARESLNIERQVDLTPLLNDIQDFLKVKYPDNNVLLELKGSLSVDCDPGLFKTALENLLDNAYKFTSKTPTPCIKIETKKEKDAILLVIEDNGAGFDPRFIDHLFLPFKRLHSQTEFTGTGIGLSIVKRIIEKHQAEIWAKSQPGTGTAFFLRLPNQKKDN